MKAVITKIGDTVTRNDNVIVNLSVENGTIEVFGVKKPKLTSFLMAFPASEASNLEVGQEQEDFPLDTFVQTEREWEAADGSKVTNTWLHTRA